MLIPGSMNTLHMLRQRRSTAKLAATLRHIALVGAHTRVNAAMAREGARIRKSLVTLGAGEWAGPSMDIDVHHESTTLNKAFVTTIKRACVRSLLRVRANMPSVRV